MQSIPSINTSHSGTGTGGFISPTNSTNNMTSPTSQTTTSPDKLLQLQQADLQPPHVSPNYNLSYPIQP